MGRSFLYDDTVIHPLVTAGLLRDEELEPEHLRLTGAILGPKLIRHTRALEILASNPLPTGESS